VRGAGIVTSKRAWRRGAGFGDVECQESSETVKHFRQEYISDEPASFMRLPSSLDEPTFQAQIRSGVVLVDFSEPWCAPCQIQLPILEHVAQRVGGRAVVSVLNVDEAPALALRYHIQALPTLILFRDGEIVRTFVGPQSENQLTRAILSATSVKVGLGVPAKGPPRWRREITQS